MRITFETLRTWGRAGLLYASFAWCCAQGEVILEQQGGILLGFARGETWGWGTIGNLMHTPIAFVHGGKDEQAPPWSDVESDRILTALATEHPGLYRHKYIFYPSAGHGVPGDGVSQAVDDKLDPQMWYPARIDL